MRLIKSSKNALQLKDTHGNVIQGSIAEKVWVEINGMKQGMSGINVELE